MAYVVLGDGMPTSFNDPRHWRARAEKMRALAVMADDLDTRASLLTLSDEYEKLARRAEERSDAVANSGPRLLNIPPPSH